MILRNNSLVISGGSNGFTKSDVLTFPLPNVTLPPSLTRDICRGKDL
jgi:hypothetical protein